MTISITLDRLRGDVDFEVHLRPGQPTFRIRARGAMHNPEIFALAIEEVWRLRSPEARRVAFGL